MPLRTPDSKFLIIFFVFFIKENVSIKYPRLDSKAQPSNDLESKTEESHHLSNRYDGTVESDKDLRRFNESKTKTKEVQLIINRYNDIIKSDKDPRSYRGLELSNRMRVILISDPKTEESAASLYVNVGSLSNPKNLMGLAHFCEHMLFMGTKKYPKENDYLEFVKTHGGSANAGTGMDMTHYFFHIQPNFLAPALDRFSQFFIAPLFTANATDREINAVNSEYEKNVPNDYRRLSQLQQHLSDPDHAYNTFTTGNKETLIDIPKQQNINIRDKLIEFYEKWYSSNIMSLGIVGKESLDELENIVVPLFSKIQNKNIKMPEWKTYPYTDAQFRTKVYISPVMDIRQLRIHFPTEDFTEYFKSDPIKYITKILNHSGSGSLSLLLKSRGWSGYITASSITLYRGANVFEIMTDLTEEGLNHVDEIVTMVFQCINMIKKVGPQAWFQQEQNNILQTTFRFKDIEAAQHYANALAGKLYKYPMKDILQAGYLLNEWRPELIEKVWKNLIPEKIRIIVSAKKFDNIVDQTEHWYGTRYKVVPIPDRNIMAWQQAGINPDFKMPEKNKFIPTNFDLLPIDKDASEFPVAIVDTPLTRVWFKQDDQFLLPKTNLLCIIMSPLTYLDPLNYNTAQLFVNLFQDYITSYTSQAQAAGINFHLYVNDDGRFGLSIGGYSDKQYTLLKTIMEELINFEIDPERFAVIKENHLRNIKNFEKEMPSSTMYYHLHHLMTERYWSKPECLAAAEQITVEDLDSFISQLFSKVRMECLVHGNVNKDQAIKLVRLIEDNLLVTLNTTALYPSQYFLNREVKLDYGEHYDYEVKNYVHKSSFIGKHFQCGLRTKEHNIKLQLLQLILSEPTFNILRTKEQLGYIVSCSVRKTQSYQGLEIAIQSNRHPNYLESRLEAFLEAMLLYLTKMGKETFFEFRETLATRILEKPKRLQTLTNTFFIEISNQFYHFNRSNDEVEYLRTITKQDILDYFTERLSSKGKKRRTVAVKIISMAEGGAGRNATEETSTKTKIDDVIMFKRHHDLSSLVKSYINFTNHENKL